MKTYKILQAGFSRPTRCDWELVEGFGVLASVSGRQFPQISRCVCTRVSVLAQTEPGVFQKSAACPSLSCELRQVVHPVSLTHASGINHMREIVFRVSQHESSMSVWITPGQRDVSRHLRRFDSSFGAGQANEVLIKMI